MFDQQTSSAVTADEGCILILIYTFYVLVDLFINLLYVYGPIQGMAHAGNKC